MKNEERDIGNRSPHALFLLPYRGVITLLGPSPNCVERLKGFGTIAFIAKQIGELSSKNKHAT